jgi:hypothetical protein
MVSELTILFGLVCAMRGLGDYVMPAVQAASESRSTMRLTVPHVTEPKPSGFGLECAFDAIRSQDWIGQYKQNE